MSKSWTRRKKKRTKRKKNSDSEKKINRRIFFFALFHYKWSQKKPIKKTRKEFCSWKFPSINSVSVRRIVSSQFSHRKTFLQQFPPFLCFFLTTATRSVSIARLSVSNDFFSACRNEEERKKKIINKDKGEKQHTKKTGRQNASRDSKVRKKAVDTERRKILRPCWKCIDFRKSLFSLCFFSLPEPYEARLRRSSSEPEKKRNWNKGTEKIEREGKNH